LAELWEFGVWLHLSHMVANLGQLTEVLTVVDAKAITAVISKVSDYQVTAKGEIIIPENRFSLMEALFIRLAVLCSIVEDDTDGIDDGNDFVE